MIVVRGKVLDSATVDVACGETVGVTCKRTVLRFPNDVNGNRRKPNRRDVESVASRLKSLLSQLGMRQAELAEAIGLSPSRMSEVLSGKAPVQPSHVIAICALYGVRREWLERGEGEIWSGGTWLTVPAGQAPALSREAVMAEALRMSVESERKMQRELEAARAEAASFRRDAEAAQGEAERLRRELSRLGKVGGRAKLARIQAEREAGPIAGDQVADAAPPLSPPLGWSLDQTRVLLELAARDEPSQMLPTLYATIPGAERDAVLRARVQRAAGTSPGPGDTDRPRRKSKVDDP